MGNKESKKGYFCINCNNFKEEEGVYCFNISIGGNGVSDYSFKCLTCKNESTNFFCTIGSNCIKCGSVGVNNGSVTYDKGRMIYATEYGSKIKKKIFSKLEEHDYLTECEGCGEKKPSHEKWLFGEGWWGSPENNHKLCNFYGILCREKCAVCILKCFVCEKSSQFKGSKNLPNQCPSCSENELFVTYYFNGDKKSANRAIWANGREYIKGKQLTYHCGDEDYVEEYHRREWKEKIQQKKNAKENSNGGEKSLHFEREEGDLYSCEHQQKSSKPCQQCENIREIVLEGDGSNFSKSMINTTNLGCEKCEEAVNYKISATGGCHKTNGKTGEELIERKHVCLSDNPTAKNFYQFFIEKKIKEVKWSDKYGEYEFDIEEGGSRFILDVSEKNRKKLEKFLQKLGKNSITKEELRRLNSSDDNLKSSFQPSQLWEFECAKCHQKLFTGRGNSKEEVQEKGKKVIEEHLRTVHGYHDNQLGELEVPEDNMIISKLEANYTRTRDEPCQKCGKDIRLKNEKEEPHDCSLTDKEAQECGKCKRKFHYSSVKGFFYCEKLKEPYQSIRLCYSCSEDWNKFLLENYDQEKWPERFYLWFDDSNFRSSQSGRLIQTLDQLEQIFLQNNIKMVKREGARLIIEFNDNNSSNSLTPEQEEQINSYLQSSNRSSLNLNEIRAEREREREREQKPTSRIPWIVGFSIVGGMLIIAVIIGIVKRFKKRKRLRNG